MFHSKERVGGHSEDLSFFPFAHENCLHFKVAPVINDKKISKAPCCDRSSTCNTMNLRSSESSPQIAPLDETIKEMCLAKESDVIVPFKCTSVATVKAFIYWKIRFS